MPFQTLSTITDNLSGKLGDLSNNMFSFKVSTLNPNPALRLDFPRRRPVKQKESAHRPKQVSSALSLVVARAVFL